MPPMSALHPSGLYPSCPLHDIPDAISCWLPGLQPQRCQFCRACPYSHQKFRSDLWNMPGTTLCTNAEWPLSGGVNQGLSVVLFCLEFVGVHAMITSCSPSGARTQSSPGGPPSVMCSVRLPEYSEAAELKKRVQKAWPGLHIMSAESIGVWVALAAVLEVVCEEDIAVLEVTLLGEQCTIVGLFHWAPQVLSAAQV